jgi:hypothetical protein
MGHKTIQMTCRYAHLTPFHQLAAVEGLVSHRMRGKHESVPGTRFSSACAGGIN